LKCVLGLALTAYLDTLRNYTLSDLLTPKENLTKMLGIGKQAV
jgi:hypothetical protein